MKKSRDQIAKKKKTGERKKQENYFKMSPSLTLQYLCVLFPSSKCRNGYKKFNMNLMEETKKNQNHSNKKKLNCKERSSEAQAKIVKNKK